MAKRILNNATTIISYDNKEDTTKIDYGDSRNGIFLVSDETFIEFDTPKEKATISIKDVIKLILKEKGLEM